MSKELVKQDINFLEYPLWMQDQDGAHNSEGKLVWEALDGFVYESGYKPPVKTDIIFLYALLLRSQKEGWTDIVELSRYELLRDSGLGNLRNSYWYKRIEESLQRWMHVVVTFEKFYEGGNRSKAQFGIIDHWKLEEGGGKLRIRLSSEWLERIEASNYFKMVDFEQIKALRSPLATRLYELLVKTFQGREDWSIGAKKLAEKIPMSEQYPAHIIPKIKTAVSRINEKTDLQIRLTIRRPKRGHAIFDFEKLEAVSLQTEKKEPIQKPQVLDVPLEQELTLQKLLELMPEKEQGKKTLRDLLARKLRKHGADYVRQNILYANKHVESNYRSYLSRALKEDWGVGFLEELEEVQEQKQAEKSETQRKRNEEKKQERIHEQAHEQLLLMSEEQQTQLEKEARASLSPKLLESPLASGFVKMQMKAILTKRIAPSDLDS